MTSNIPLFKTDSHSADIEAVAAVIHRGTFWAVGPELIQFENDIKQLIGANYCASFNSGTSALHSVIDAYGLAGSEVIVPSFSFIATANSVVLGGAKPVFAETEGDTYGLDVSDVKSRITDRTSAIIILHYGGCPARDTIPLMALARENGLILIEDAAESLAADIGGQMVGTFGDSAIFSFCQNKVVSTGEGGVAVTCHESIFERMKLFRSHGRFEDTPGDYFNKTGESDYVTLGYNYRMSSITAALGSSQLSRLNSNIAKRQRVAEHYTSLLRSSPEIQPLIIPPNHRSVFQMYTIKAETREMRDGLQDYLFKRGIMTKVYFQPIHLTRYYKGQYGYCLGDLPYTENLSERVLTLPLFPNMELHEVERVVSDIVGYLKG